MKSIVLAAIFWGVPAHASCQALIGTCDFYQCFSHDLGSGPKDYPLHFAFHYCQKFDRNHDYFSKRGERFLDGVKVCLQQKLLAEPNVSRDNIESLAAQHHVECYQENHFCEISFLDKVRIGDITLAAYLKNKSFRHTGRKIFATCDQD